MSRPWLVRTELNQIIGPFPKETVQEMVLSGKLSLQDEVCESTHFWIYLHQRDLLMQHLGVAPPKAAGPETDGDTGKIRSGLDDDKTDPQGIISPHAPQAGSPESSAGVNAGLQAGAQPRNRSLVRWILVLLALLLGVYFVFLGLKFRGSR